MARRVDGSQIGFLAMAFVIVGLAGIFATYAAPVPLARVMHKEAVLDQVLAAGAKPDAASLLATLRPALGTSAGRVLEGPGTLNQRVAEERARLATAAMAEQASVSARLRLIIIIATLAAAIFGVAMLGVRSGGP